VPASALRAKNDEKLKEKRQREEKREDVGRRDKIRWRRIKTRNMEKNERRICKRKGGRKREKIRLAEE
jgi:hypothetical protein